MESQIKKKPLRIRILKPEPIFVTNLKNNGWAIVKGVTKADFAQETASKFWKWFENFNTGIDREKPETWKTKDWPVNLHGIIQWYGLGHEQFVWDVRMREEIIKIFAEIYKDDKLLVSFDGGNCSKVSNVKTKSWAHIDQGHKKIGFRCVQGFLNLNPCGEKDGGLVVYQGSHKLHEKIWEGGKKATGDWYKFTPEELEIFKDCPIVKVCCEPGDIVLWDSRAVHWAKAPELGDKSRTRMVVYVSYQPAKLATNATLNKKKTAFKERRMTSHWAAENIKLFPKNPRTYGDDSKIERFKVNTELPTLNERGQRLAGLIEY